MQLPTSDNRYYCYRHIRLDKNEPFYIGIGKKQSRNPQSEKAEYKRAFAANCRSALWKRIYEKNDREIIVEILYECQTKEEVCEKEKEFIKLHGRIDLKTGTLANLTPGGECVIGKSANKGKIGKPWTEERKKWISSINKGRKRAPFSEETRLKMSLAKRNNPKPLNQAQLDSLAKGRTNNSGASNPSAKLLYQFSLEGDLIKVWNCVIEAERELNLKLYRPKNQR